MSKLIWILILSIVIIAMVYFTKTKNNTSNTPELINTEQSETKTIIKSSANNTGEVPQPPKLPE